jgi:transcriptional regulator GlxA family with amidase domain
MKIMNFTIGIVMLDPFQIIDAVGPVELLAMAGRKYLSTTPDTPPYAPNVAIHWISPTMKTTGVATSDMGVVTTSTFDKHPKLDILFVPGPPLNWTAPPDVAKFILRAAKEVPIVMSDCTGPFVLAQLGMLDGKNATLNRLAIPLAKQLYPKVNWQENVRWAIDGKIWTGAGAVSAMSMAIAFLQSGKWGNLHELPLTVAEFIEFEPKGQFRD